VNVQKSVTVETAPKNKVFLACCIKREPMDVDQQAQFKLLVLCMCNDEILLHNSDKPGGQLGALWACKHNVGAVIIDHLNEFPGPTEKL
jgi:hypothetical protein